MCAGSLIPQESQIRSAQKVLHVEKNPLSVGLTKFLPSYALRADSRPVKPAVASLNVDPCDPPEDDQAPDRLL